MLLWIVHGRKMDIYVTKLSLFCDDSTHYALEFNPISCQLEERKDILDNDICA